MENQPLLDSSTQAALARASATASSSTARRHYVGRPVDDADAKLGLDECLQILKRRKLTLIFIIALGLLTAMLFTLPQIPIYEARDSIEIQKLNENFLNAGNVNPVTTTGVSSEAGSDVQIQTEVKILQSDTLLERVATKLDSNHKEYRVEGNGRRAALRKILGLPVPIQAPTREKILNAPADSLKIGVDPNTRVVEIRYDSPDPQLSADFVNTLTSEFVSLSVESHLKSSQQTGEGLTGKTEDARIKLEKSEEELQKYAKASDLLFTSQQSNVADDKLRQLQEELSKAQADRGIIQSKYELVSKASADSLPEVLDDPTLKDFQVKLADLHAQLAQMSRTLTQAHPAVQKVEDQITSLEEARDQERADVVQRIRNEYEAAQRREHLAAANYAAQASLMSEQGAKVAHYNNLKNEVDTERQMYDSMLQNVQEAGMSSALGASNVRIVDPAGTPTHPYKPNFPINSGLGLLAGLFFGVGTVLSQERSNRSIKGPGDSAAYLDVPELGAIPSADADGSRLFSYEQAGKALESNENGKPSQVELVISDKARSFLADSFRATLTSILYSGENGDRPRVIVITSGSPQEGKTTIASNLGLALAEIGPPILTQPVLLIDGDMRRPRLHQIFGVPNRWGLSDLLEGKTPPPGSEELYFKTGFKNLCLLPAGSVVSNVSALLHSPRTSEYLNRMREEFHTIIIDTPPMLNIPDARVLGRFADGVILVVRSSQTIRDSALAIKQRLTEDGTRILGTILNQWNPRKTNSYGYGRADKNYHDINRG